MHEFSICESIFSAVKKEYKNINTDTQVNAVYLTIGEMHQVVEENLRIAWEVVTKDSPFEHSLLNITWQPVILECNECGHKKHKEDLLFLCGNCGSRNVEIIQGRELYISQMGVETDE